MVMTERVYTDPSFVARYMTRSLNYKNTSLIAMAKKYYSNRDRWLTHKNDVIVRLVPEIDRDISQNSEK